MIIFAFGADRFGSSGEDDDEEETHLLIEYSAVDFYQTLIKERKGEAP